jgi:hypothetical protein
MHLWRWLLIDSVATGSCSAVGCSVFGMVGKAVRRDTSRAGLTTCLLADTEWTTARDWRGLSVHSKILILMFAPALDPIHSSVPFTSGALGLGSLAMMRVQVTIVGIDDISPVRSNQFPSRCLARTEKCVSLVAVGGYVSLFGHPRAWCCCGD